MDAREIDIALAEKLFGWVIESPEHGWPPSVGMPGYVFGRPPDHYSTTWEGMGLVVEAMEAKGYEWQVWPKAVEFRPRQRSYDAGPGTSAGYSEGRGYLLNTAIAALKALGVEVPAE